jgi:hypothetical protein
MDIKQTLRRVADLDASSGNQYQPETIEACRYAIAEIARRALAEIERLEAGPCHQVCVHAPVGGYPHESDCPGCRMEKTCYRCGHFVDMLSKHR